MRTTCIRKVKKTIQKVSQKNENKQVVNVNIGERKQKSCSYICKDKKIRRKKIRRNKKRQSRPLLRKVIRFKEKIKRCDVVRKEKIQKCDGIGKPQLTICESVGKEKICINFKLRKSGIRHLLWEAVGVVPSGSLLIHNKSTEQVHVLIQRVNGSEVTVWVEPKSEVALTFPDIVRITACCASHVHCEDTVCFGVLTLCLQIPHHSCASRRAEKPSEVLIKTACTVPVDHTESKSHDHGQVSFVRTLFS